MKGRAERFKKASSTPSDASIETLMICTYYSKKYLSDNNICSINERVSQKPVYPWRYFSYQVESLNFHFESKSKKSTNHYRPVQWTKNLPKMLY